MPKEETVCSRPLHLFFNDYESAINHLIYPVIFAESLDDRALMALEALSQIVDDEHNKTKYKNKVDAIKASGGDARARLKEFIDLLPRNVVCNISDAFLAYLVSVTAAAFKAKPELLKSSRSLTYEEVVTHVEMGDLYDFMLGKVINELSYKSFWSVIDFIEEKTGVNLNLDNEDRLAIKVLVESRNLIVHKRGYPDEKFFKNVGASVKIHGVEFSFEKDRRIKFDMDDLEALLQPCFKAAVKLDADIAKKFTIKRRKRSAWIARHPGKTGLSPSNVVQGHS
jgi:hypothetical protein